MNNRTFAIIKPDATKNDLTGKIYNHILNNGFKILAEKLIKMDKQHAENFYLIHKDKPFFSSLINYMTSNRILVLKIEGKNAIDEYRKLMGSTDPSNADSGTIRKLFAESIERNSVHGSDTIENANIEIKFFFR